MPEHGKPEIIRPPRRKVKSFADLAVENARDKKDKLPELEGDTYEIVQISPPKVDIRARFRRGNDTWSEPVVLWALIRELHGKKVQRRVVGLVVIEGTVVSAELSTQFDGYFEAIVTPEPIPK